jgi:hypothetical protein
MDATLYLEKFMSMHQELTTMVKTYANDADLGMAVRKLVK